MNDIDKNADAIEEAFNHLMGWVCLKRSDGTFAVLTFAPAESGRYLALYDRGNHAFPPISRNAPLEDLEERYAGW